MEKFLVASLLVLFLNLASLIPSSACPYCPYSYKSPPPPPPLPKKFPCPPPPKVKLPPPPPKIKPPIPPPRIKPSPPPPEINPSPHPKPKPSPPPPKITPPPPKITPPPPPTILPSLPPPPPPQVPCPPPPVTHTCPINTLKLDACVDLLGDLLHIGIGQSATSTCCPLLEGLADLDAALCLCTTVKAKVLNINIILPIALEVLLDCGKHLPSDYQCPA